MSTKKINPNQVFIYAGDGLGVPGLPHRVTREEAAALGRADDLEAAIARGDYKTERAAKPAEDEE